VKIMRNEWVRLKLLSKLGLRSDSAFFALSPGGPTAIDAAMAKLKEQRLIGDYLEFGVYRGYTLWYAQRSADRSGFSEMRFFGFDSFEGLPEVQGNDRKAALFFAGDYRCGREEVERNLVDHGFDMDRAKLVEGYFNESLTTAVKKKLGMRSAALVMIDCDLYQSTVPVLDFIADLLQSGSIILFDDWDCFGGAEDLGELRAFREFLDGHPEWTAEPFVRFREYGRGFIMRPSVPRSPDGP